MTRLLVRTVEALAPGLPPCPAEARRFAAEPTSWGSGRAWCEGALLACGLRGAALRMGSWPRRGNLLSPVGTCPWLGPLRQPAGSSMCPGQGQVARLPGTRHLRW